jgi:hypothetical protein
VIIKEIKMKPQIFKELVPKIILVIVFMLFNLQGLKAQNLEKMENKKDILMIRTALENIYFKGLYEGNIDLLATIFHHDTLLFGDIKGVPYAKTLDQYLDGVKNRQNPKDSGRPFKGEILSLHIINSIAVAEVNVTMYDFNYHDILSFHKINDKWLIVNKMLTDTNQ